MTGKAWKTGDTFQDLPTATFQNLFDNFILGIQIIAPINGSFENFQIDFQILISGS